MAAYFFIPEFILACDFPGRFCPTLFFCPRTPEQRVFPLQHRSLRDMNLDEYDVWRDVFSEGNKQILRAPV